MSPDGASLADIADSGPRDRKNAGAPDFTAYVQQNEGGASTLHAFVEGIHCGGCVNRIERTLNAEPDVDAARVNLSTRRLTVSWDGPPERGNALAAAVENLGFGIRPFDPAMLGRADRSEEKTLLRAMAVAGFAAANVMLLSVSVWSGGDGDMSAATRDMMHWFSALIALPAVAYAGRPFFRAALGALRAGRLNMEVPISLAVVLASGMSLFETMRGGAHVYFDSAITLLFFLLIGRFLDRRARGHARAAAERLLALRAGAVTVLDKDGARTSVRPDQVHPGMRVLVATGERIPVDGQIVAGVSDIDTSLLTGESDPATARPGENVFAGTMNLSAPLEIETRAVGDGTLLADIIRLMEAAEDRRAKYVSLADRAARLYAPLVHGLAAVTLAGWLVAGLEWQTSLLHAVAVLIITCPCALALAVPAVQVVACSRLMKRGILAKDGTALERLVNADMVVFDKTGTLTLGRPVLVNRDAIGEDDLRLAAGMAAASSHPLSRAIAGAVTGNALSGVQERPGEGLEWHGPDGPVRLGKAEWLGIDTAAHDDPEGPELWLQEPGAAPVRFAFSDEVRPGAEMLVGSLRARGLPVVLLSGDREPVVGAMAGMLGIEVWRAACSPVDKSRFLREQADAGRRVLMVGDGLNDAPALAEAYVSISPSSASDVSQTAADLVFQGRSLLAVEEAMRTAAASRRLILQNFGLAIAYNLVTIPLAMAGFVTPLIAALCMSGSSIAVVLNALRLGKMNFRRGRREWMSSST